MKIRLVLFLLFLSFLWKNLGAQSNFYFAPEILDKIRGLRVDCAGAAIEQGIQIGAIGGVPPYTYTLTLNNRFVAQGQLEQNQIRAITNLRDRRQNVGIIAGTYELVIRDSKGCTLKHRFGISEPEPIRIVSHVTNPGRREGDDGAIRLVGISGGLPGSANMPYKINWYMEMGGRSVAIPGSENQMILSDLRAGNYRVRVSDYSMPECFAESSFTLIAPPPLSGSHTIVRPILCNSRNSRSDIGSFNFTGILRAVASGGTPPYTYKWYDKNKRLLQAGIDPEIRNLGPGEYSVDIEDANNHNYTVCCINLQEPDPIVVTRSYATDISGWDACSSYATITFDVSATRYNNLKAYAYYHINNPQAQNKGPEVISNLQPFGNRLTLFQPGEYYIIVEDLNGCRAEGPKTVVNTQCLSCCGNQGNSEPIQNFRVTQQNPCINGLGSISVDEVRHINSTTLKNNFNDRYLFEILNLDGTPYFFSGDTFRNATGEFRNLEGGRAYVISVFDRISRTRFYRSFNMPYNTFYFDTLASTAPVAVHPVSCNGRNDGRIEIIRPPIQNQNGSIYECKECLYEIRDFNTDRPIFRTTGLIDPMQQISTFALPAGDYRLCVLPPNNSTDPRFECLRQSRYCYPQPLRISQPSSLELVAQAEKTRICSPSIYGVSTTNINVQVKGGMPPYNVSFYQNNQLIPPYRMPLVIPVGADRVYNYSFPVIAGDYAVEAVDENGCVASASLSISNFPTVRLAAQQGGSNCYEVIESGGVVLQGGHISIVPSGGQPGYLAEVFNYWENERRTFPISAGEGLRVPALAGLYTVKVYDSNNTNGCLNSNFSQVNVSLNPQLNICHTITERDGRGRIDLTVSGGVPPYSYRWSNNATTPFLDNLTLGSFYSVTVTDANNCVRTASFMVTSLDESAAGGEKLLIYPNPTQSSLQIAANWLLSGKSVMITIINPMGQVVQNAEFSATSETITLDVASLTSGVYIIKINAGAKQWVQSFIKN